MHKGDAVNVVTDGEAFDIDNIFNYQTMDWAIVNDPHGIKNQAKKAFLDITTYVIKNSAAHTGRRNLLNIGGARRSLNSVGDTAEDWSWNEVKTEYSNNGFQIPKCSSLTRPKKHLFYTNKPVRLRSES